MLQKSLFFSLFLPKKNGKVLGEFFLNFVERCSKLIFFKIIYDFYCILVGNFFWTIPIYQISPNQFCTTGYTCQGSLTCLSRSSGFNLTGPADLFSAQSHTELRVMNFQIYRFLIIHFMIIRPATYKRLLQDTFKKNKIGFMQHFNSFRGV